MDDTTRNAQRNGEKGGRWPQSLPTSLGGLSLLVAGMLLGWWGTMYQGWSTASALIAIAVLLGAGLVSYRYKGRTIRPVEIGLIYLIMVAAGYLVGVLIIIVYSADLLPLLNWHIPATPIGVSL